MKRLLPLLLPLLLATAQPSLADPLTATKRADIEKLLAATGTLEIGKQMSAAMVQQMTTVLKQSRPDIPPRAFDIMEEVINETLSEGMDRDGGLMDQLIENFNRHFTDEEIKGLLEFYGSDLGKKTVRVMPLLTQENMAAGRRWGKSLGPTLQKRLRERFRAEGIKL